MKRSIKISNFKCFDELTLSLNSLTALCGPNSGGKSTLIQAFLLYAQGVVSEGIPTNGPYGLQLGDADELVSRNATHGESDRFSIALDPGHVVSFSTGAAPRHLSTTVLKTDALRAEIVIYLSAERVGPRVAQESYSNRDSGSSDLGYAGQYTAEVLLAREREHVREELRPAGGAMLLLPLVEHYMSLLFGPIEVQARPNGNAPPSLYFKRPGVEEEWVLSSNTGFGITYALPVIVGGLLAPAGATFIIDSPEAHLHPSAQTAVARFLCRVAASGVNVIIETHSDYIIDGIRIDVTSADSGSLRPDDCTLISVSRDGDGGRDVRHLTIQSDGKPSDWPQGFFDQHLLNMRSLLANTAAISRKK